METEPRISFRNLEPLESVREHVIKRIRQLEEVHPRIVGCDVVIEAPQRKKVTGQEFEVHVTVQVPGENINVSRSVGRSFAAEDVNIAIHQAFDAARKRLKTRKKKMGKVEVKEHPPVLHGKVNRLFPGEGYGFIQADDGKDVFFERDSLTAENWNNVQIGSVVRFREESGDKGPFATSVTIDG
jgi:cold shock CspA family protein/ribosome-associated translation inhibitor RaiA